MNTLLNILPNKTKALYLAKRELAVLVYDAVNLEGIHYLKFLNVLALLKK